MNTFDESYLEAELALDAITPYTQHYDPANPSTTLEQVLDTIVIGDAVPILTALPDTCVDFVLTDPPYIVRYASRDGRTVANDDTTDWLLPVYTELFRVLKPDSLCVSFYGWHRIDLFLAAWKTAGFSPVGHIVWAKKYASKAGFVNYTHESAFVLAKGKPPKPANPIDDVLPWKYSGNKLHPTQKPVMALSPLIRSFTEPGDIVLDPFCGSGSTAVAAQLYDRHFVGIELEAAYGSIAAQRLEAVRTIRP